MKKILLSIFCCMLAVIGLQAQSYVKVTTAPADWEGDYLIVYETNSVAFNGGMSTLDARSNTIAVKIDDNEIAATDATNAAKFTIEAVSGGYAIKSASGNYIGVSSNSNGLKQTTTSTTYKHSLSIDASANAVIKAEFSGSTMALRFNKATGELRFRYYKNSGQQAIQLYKYTEGTGGGDEVIVAQPTFNPAAGAVTKGTEVELSCETVDATIYYALGESDDFVEYNEAITINEATTIKAYAKLGDAESAIVSATYTIAKLAVPTFTPQGGMVAAGTEVTISHADDGATIHYAIGDANFIYDGTAIVINEATTITAYATKEGYDNSDEVTAEYTMLPEGTSVGTIDFSTADQRVSQTTEVQVWSNEGITFTNNKTSGSSNVVENVNPVRLYKNSEIVIECANGNIAQIVFACNSEAYATDLKKAIGDAALSGSEVTVTLNGTSDSFSATLSEGQVRLDSLTVTYVANPDPEEVAVPTFNPAAGPVTKGTQVELSCETADATIYYAIGEGAFVEYDGTAIVVNEETTINAYAKLGDAQSDTVSATYTIAQLPAPIFNPAAGAVEAGTEVTISAAPGATIYYAIGEGAYVEYDGTAIVINEVTTISAYAMMDGYTQSQTVTATYTIKADAPDAGGEGTGVYELITDVNDLVVGRNIILVGVKDGTYYTMAQQKNNNRGSVAVDLNANETITPAAETTIIKLGQEGANYTFSTPDGYLYAASNSSNHLKSQATNNANGQWSISVELDGTTSIIAQGANSRNVMQFNYNNGAPLFSCYAADKPQLNVYIYQEVVANPEPEVYPENIVCEQNYYLDVEGSDWTIAEGNSLAACFVNKNTDATTWSVGEYLADTKHYVFYLSQYNVPAAAPARAKAEETPVYTHVKFVNFEGATDALTPWVDGTRVNETAELTYTPAVDYEYTIYSVAGGAWVGKNDGISTGLEAVEADGMVYAGNVVAAEGAIEVYNLSGAVVARGNNRVDLKGLAGGVYVVRCGNDVLKVVR